MPDRLLRPACHALTSLLLAGAAAAGAAPAQAAHAADARLDARTSAQLERALTRAHARTWAPGVIAGVWAGGRGWTATRGVADRTTGARVRLGTHTRIGSVTKTFTGTLVLRLVGQGRLRLDDTIERWFPTLPDANRITIRQLGSMSSGIASYSLDAATVDRYLARPRAAWTPAELTAAGTALPRMFSPGAGFRYSNTNFVMLGQIVEQVTGRPLAQVMREQIFRPLGMRSTTYAPLDRLPAPAWRGSTLQGADGAVLDATGWSPTFAGAAGQMVSTLADLRRWTRALGTGSLLKPAMRRAQLVANPASRRGGRAYAFAVGRAKGWLMHSGELPGYNTQIAYLPARRLAIVVMANADVPGPQGNPAPAIFDALADVVAPGTLPAG